MSHIHGRVRGEVTSMTSRVSTGVGLMLGGFTVAGLGLVLGFTYAPTMSSDAWNAPETYRILFWHVPSAWTSFLAFGMLFVGSLFWYTANKEWAWKLSGIAAELGLLYGLCVITSGPIWGAAEWGVSWDWTDVRLNSYAVLTAVALFLVLGRRSQPDTPAVRDIFSTVGLFGFLLVPLTYMATRWWQERHPGPLIGTDDPSSGVSTEILIPWLISFVGFTILMVGQTLTSAEVQKCESRLAELQHLIDERNRGAKIGE